MLQQYLYQHICIGVNNALRGGHRNLPSPVANPDEYNVFSALAFVRTGSIVRRAPPLSCDSETCQIGERASLGYGRLQLTYVKTCSDLLTRTCRSVRASYTDTVKQWCSRKPVLDIYAVEHRKRGYQLYTDKSNDFTFVEKSHSSVGHDHHWYLLDWDDHYTVTTLARKKQIST